MSQPIQAPPGIRRPNGFGALRLGAALCVVVHHANHDLGTTVGGFAPRLVDGVAIFFTLSGMLVFLAAEKVVRRGLGWRSFFTNRLLRLLPALLVFALVAPLVLVATGALSIGSLASPASLVWLASALLLVPVYDPPAFRDAGVATINDQLYTLPAELSFYLAVPLILRGARRFGLLRVVAVVALSAFLLRVLASALGPTLQEVLGRTFVERAPFFLAGILLARYGRRLPLRWWLFLPAAALSSTVLFVSGTGYVVPLPAPMRPLLAAAPLAYAVFYAGIRTPALLIAVTARVGDLSYGVYLWHPLLLILLVRAGLAGHGFAVGAAVLGALLAALVSWRLIEKPALRLRRRSLRLWYM